MSSQRTRLAAAIVLLAVVAAVLVLASHAADRALPRAAPAPTFKGIAGPIGAKAAASVISRTNFTPAQQVIIQRNEALEHRCRDGSGDDPATIAACDLRDAATQRLNAAGICWGKQGQAEYEYTYQHCGPSSLGYTN